MLSGCVGDEYWWLQAVYMALAAIPSMISSRITNKFRSGCWSEARRPIRDQGPAIPKIMIFWTIFGWAVPGLGIGSRIWNVDRREEIVPDITTRAIWALRSHQYLCPTYPEGIWSPLEAHRGPHWRQTSISRPGQYMSHLSMDHATNQKNCCYMNVVVWKKPSGRGR